MVNVKILYLLLSLVVIGGLYAQSNMNINKAEIALIQGDYEQAIVLYKQLIKTNSDPAGLYYGLGLAYRGMEQHPQALSCFKKARIADQDNIRISLAISESYQALGILHKAKQVLLQLLTSDPDNLVAKTKLGRIYYADKDFKQAYLLYKCLLEKYPRNHSFNKKLALCARELNRNEEAKRFYRRALVLVEDDISSYLYLGDLLVKNDPDSLKTALTIAASGLKYDGENKRLRKLKGDILFKMEDYIHSLEDYKKLYGSGDTTAVLLKKMGMCYFNLNDFPSALYSLAEASKLDSSDGLIFYYLGLTYKNLKNYHGAAEVIKKSINLLIPEYTADIYIELAQCYTQTNEFGQAIAIYKNILQQEPERKIILYYLACSYDRFYADRQAALNAYKKFLPVAVEEYPALVDYVENRIQKIAEEIHFNKKQ